MCWVLKVDVYISLYVTLLLHIGLQRGRRMLGGGGGWWLLLFRTEEFIPCILIRRLIIIHRCIWVAALLNQLNNQYSALHHMYYTLLRPRSRSTRSSKILFRVFALKIISTRSPATGTSPTPKSNAILAYICDSIEAGISACLHTLIIL